jgi:D-glycero-D-manno-heptose 1,7-bisphosphate phosphatase
VKLNPPVSGEWIFPMSLTASLPPRDSAPLRPAVFLDRDGTLTEEIGYANHPLRLRLIPGVAEAIRRFNDAGILTIVVTNQAGAARGYFTEDLIDVTHQHLRNLLRRATGAELDAIFYCPHHSSVGPPELRMKCHCRKPAPGMIQRAAAQLPVDLSRSIMVGDKISDSEFGHGLGLRTVMVMTGYGLGEHIYQRQSWTDTPDLIAPDLGAATDWIIEQCGTPVSLPIIDLSGPFACGLSLETPETVRALAAVS